MRAVAILGIFVCAALALLCYKWAMDTYKDEKDGELYFGYPSWIGFGLAVLMAIASILCLIYAIGLWDAFVAWGHFGQPKYPVLKQF